MAGQSWRTPDGVRDRVRPLVRKMTVSLHDRVVAALGDQYELQGEIGRGGMSVVYRARDARLNRVVAIKVLPPELAYDPAILTRFTREAQTAAHLAHPHIVPIFDVGERDGIAYFVMALVGGGNLANALARDPRQPIAEVRRVVCEVADALAFAHLRGVVHRDIKPDNILIDPDSGRTMVTDFGIARAVEAGTRLTVTGIAVGTPTYMSPEQAMGDREIDGRTDIYSLGVVAYQMLTGRLPFTAGNSMALLLKHVSERPKPIAELRPDAPPALREAIERALAKAPEDRWPTASALRDALLADHSTARSSVEPWSPGSPVAPMAAEAPVVARAVATGLKRPPVVPVIDKLTGTIIQPEHTEALSPEQRDDLRVWGGRTNLFDRVKAARRLAALAVVGWTIGFPLAMVGTFEAEIPPLILYPLLPIYWTRRAWLRGASLRLSGFNLKRVFLMPRAKWAFPRPAVAPAAKGLEKIAPRALLESQHGGVIRRAADDRAAIMDIVNAMSKQDRSLLPDVVPTANALVERVVELATAIQRLDDGLDLSQLRELDDRIGQLERSTVPQDAQRLTLFRRQRATLDELIQRRGALSGQLESAGLALGNLRLELLKFRASGMQGALSDISTATQEARALSRDLVVMSEAAAEMRKL